MVSITDNHRVQGARIVDFTFGGGASLQDPRLVVVHYSASNDLAGTEFTLQSRGLSYHVLVDVDGSFHQIRPFNRSAGHAGRSNWKARSNLRNGSSVNGESIGVSMINLGGFMSFSNGKWFWGDVGREPSMPDAQATKAALTYRPSRPNHWTPYTRAQLDACRELVGALVGRYPSIEEVVGHHDVAIEGKIDPGPLCPLEDWRNQLDRKGPLGLEAEVKSPDGELNLRDRPGSGGRVERVLRNGDVVHIRAVTYAGPSGGLMPEGGNQRTLTGWASVDVDGSNRHAGFVYLGLVNHTPLHPSFAARL